MLRFFVILIFAFISAIPVYAIDWHDVYSNTKKCAYVDVDSIKEYKNYYFYNIKVLNVHTNEFVVITMQSKKTGTLSARIKYYKPDEYADLNGEYEHITDNMSKKLEPVKYGSVAYACYSYVKYLMASRQLKIEI